MATKKKKSAPKKAAPAKAAAKKPAAKKTMPPKKKSSTKSATKPAEHQATNAALKLVDEAAALLRKGIRTSADTTDKSRHAAKQKAHTLLNKASSSLSDILSGGTSALRSVINKI